MGTVVRFVIGPILSKGCAGVWRDDRFMAGPEGRGREGATKAFGGFEVACVREVERVLVDPYSVKGAA